MITMYKVIEGRQIRTRYKPGFIRGCLSEKDFLDFIKKSQSYFIAGDFEDRETYICGKTAYGIWVDPTRAVVAEQIGRNKYRVTNNGNQRAYVARKYGYKLLIYIEDNPAKNLKLF